MTMAAPEVDRFCGESGALGEDHSIPPSGRHSPLYLEKFQVLQHPVDTERWGAAIASWVRLLGADTVAGPTTGGIILAHEVARQLGARAIYAERRANGIGREFRRGFALRSGERVAVVDDIMTTGGSVQETIEAVRSAGGEGVGAAGLVDCSRGEAHLGVPRQAFGGLGTPSFPHAACPAHPNGKL